MIAIAPQEMAHKIDVLRRHCQTEGRDSAEVRITAISGADPVAATAGFLDIVSAYAQLGVDQISVTPRGPDLAGWVGAAARLVPQLNDL